MCLSDLPPGIQGGVRRVVGSNRSNVLPRASFDLDQMEALLTPAPPHCNMLLTPTPTAEPDREGVQWLVEDSP